MERQGSGVAIAGIGFTDFTRDRTTPRSAYQLAVEACRRAIADAGLRPDQVGGIVSHQMNDAPIGRDIARAVGLKELTWWSDVSAGGNYAGAVLAHAASAIHSGLAERIVCFRAMAGYSGRRIGQGAGAADDATGIGQFVAPYGMAMPAEIFGMPARRHMHEYGTTKEQFGAVAISARRHASMNERAIRREALTIDEYLAAPVIADPYGLLDCCQENDGACAAVLCRDADAKELRADPVYLLGGVVGAGPNPRLPFDGWADMAASCAPRLAQRLYAHTGLGPLDVDVALLYDGFTFEVIKQLEDFGFCDQGEGGPFVESGAIDLTGSIPVNTHGGLLSEAYVHGFNHTMEAVLQLRGDGGDRQVKSARVALVTGFGFSSASAVLLGSERINA